MSDVFWFQLITALIIGGITATLASLRGRSRGLWFCIGAFFGPLGLLALFFMPKIQQDGEKSAKKQNHEEEKKQNQRDEQQLSLKEAMPQAAEASLQPGTAFEPVRPLSLEEIAASQWYYIDRSAKEAKGPIGITELCDLWKKEVLKKHSFVWSKRLKSWTKVHEIEMLMSYFRKRI